MIKKIFFSLLFLLVSVFILMIYNHINTETTLVSNDITSTLNLDQGDTYIAISKNDATGYNRWIPFYFTVKSKGNSHNVEQQLKEQIQSITIFNIENEPIFTTTDLIWSAYQVDDTTFNLSLVIIPLENELLVDSEVNLSKLTFKICSNEKVFNKTFNLDTYILDSVETVSEDRYYISNTTIETHTSDNLSAELHYSIVQDDTTNNILNFQLEYAEGFADMKSTTTSPAQLIDNALEYTAYANFNSLQPKVVFRPKIKIQLDSSEVCYLIPSVPAYIN